MRPLANTIETMCWFSFMTLMFFLTIILENILHFNTDILLLDFSFISFYFSLSIRQSNRLGMDDIFAWRSGGRTGLHPTVCSF